MRAPSTRRCDDRRSFAAFLAVLAVSALACASCGRGPQPEADSPLPSPTVFTLVNLTGRAIYIQVSHFHGQAFWGLRAGTRAIRPLPTCDHCTCLECERSRVCSQCGRSRAVVEKLEAGAQRPIFWDGRDWTLVAEGCVLPTGTSSCQSPLAEVAASLELTVQFGYSFRVTSEFGSNDELVEDPTTHSVTFSPPRSELRVELSAPAPARAPRASATPHRPATRGPAARMTPRGSDR